MNILGIETSCDETAASVVKNGRFVLSNVVASSLSEHQKFGGIIPEIASRRQIELINLVVKRSLALSGCNLKNIDAVAVTQSPGLIGSLLVGISFARALSYALQKPLIEVNHIQAHLYANFLELDGQPFARPQPKLPAIGLVVSGGHSSLFLVKSFHDYKLLGQTRDDAVGEAFDKVARILDLGYPGGPVIDRLAKEEQKSDIHFSCADLSDTNDFSFSGIKTAVLYHVRKYQRKEDIPVKKIAYAFQASVVTAIVNKCAEICLRKKNKTLLVGGGVAANSALRRGLAEMAQKEKINVFFPPLPLCIDNAAMIAGLGYHLTKKKGR